MMPVPKDEVSCSSSHSNERVINTHTYTPRLYSYKLTEGNQKLWNCLHQQTQQNIQCPPLSNRKVFNTQVSTQINHITNKNRHGRGKQQKQCYVHQFFDFDRQRQLAVCKSCSQTIWMQPNDFTYLQLTKHLQIVHQVSASKCEVSKETSTVRDYFFSDLVRKNEVCTLCMAPFQMPAKVIKLCEHMRSDHPEVRRKKFTTRPSTPGQLQKYPTGFRSRVKRSIVWEIFSIHKPEGSTGSLCNTQGIDRGKDFTGEVVICRVCNYCIRRKNNYGTGELLLHFRKVHPQLYIQTKFSTTKPENPQQTVKQYVKFVSDYTKKSKKGQGKCSSDICLDELSQFYKPTPFVPSRTLQTGDNMLKPGLYQNISAELLNESAIAACCPSFVWEVFQQSHASSKIATCQLCNLMIQQSSDRSLIPLINHLQQDHFEVFWVLQKQKYEGLFDRRNRARANRTVKLRRQHVQPPLNKGSELNKQPTFIGKLENQGYLNAQTDQTY